MLICIISDTAATALFLTAGKNTSSAPANKAGTAADNITGIYNGLFFNLFIYKIKTGRKIVIIYTGIHHILRFSLFNDIPVSAINEPDKGSKKNTAVNNIYVIIEIISDFLVLSVDSKYASRAIPAAIYKNIPKTAKTVFEDICII